MSDEGPHPGAARHQPPPDLLRHGGVSSPVSGEVGRGQAGGGGPSSYLYSIIQIVPDIERDERFNVGVILFCRSRRFLAARTHLDRGKLAALATELDAATIHDQLAAVELVAAGDLAAGPLARLEQAERFHWLVAPGSTTVQPSAVHTGLTADPAAALDRLFRRLVGVRSHLGEAAAPPSSASRGDSSRCSE